LKRWAFLTKKKISRKGIPWVIIGLVLFVVVLIFGVIQMAEVTKKMEEEIALKKKVLIKYSEFLQNRKTIEEELVRIQKRYEVVQQSLLTGETPQLSAASLQEMVKRLLEKNGMTIRGFRILEPKDLSIYRRISIHIDFNPVNNLLSLIQFIHDIESNDKALMISEMDLLVPNPRMPNSIQGSFVISGLTKVSKTKEKGRER